MTEIEIDASSLTCPLVAIADARAALVEEVHPSRARVSLPAATSYRLRHGYQGLSAITFHVNADGTLDFDTAFDGLLSGRGERRLTVRGYQVRVDTTALGHALMPHLPGAAPLPPDRPHDLTLLPSSRYRLDLAAGGIGHVIFDVALDGSVQIDPAYASVASARGNTLTVRGLTINVDGRALSHDLLPIGFAGPASFLPRATINQLALLPGTGYGFQPGSGVVADLTFGVGAEGEVLLDPAYAGFASASGNTLTIRGQTINIDARAMSHDLLPIGIASDVGFLPRDRVNQLTLIPASGYGFQPGSGIVADFWYRVARDGSISFDPDYAPFARAESRTLVIRGHAIQINGRALSHDLLPTGIASDIGFLSRNRVNQLTLIPADNYGFQPGSGIVADLRYRIERDGRVSVDPVFASFASTSDRTLTIRGHMISIDGRALSHDLLPLGIASDIGFLPRDRVNQLTIIPASGYGFQPGPGVVADFRYQIERDGRASVDPAFALFANTSGSTLIVRGHVVNIDGRSLSHDLLPIGIAGDGLFLSRERVNQLTLVPASGYGFQPGSGLVADFGYRVGVNGDVDFPSSCDPFLAGRGTSTLVVRGFPLVLSAADADSDLVGVPAIGLLAQSPRELFAVLVPAQFYLPQTRNGIFRTWFNVERDGRITFDPTSAGSYVVRNSSEPNPSQVGDQVTIRVQVQPVPTTPAQPTGAVTFKIGNSLLGTAPLGLGGDAVLRTSGIPQGEHEILIEYGGSPEFAPSAMRVRHVVE